VTSGAAAHRGCPELQESTGKELAEDGNFSRVHCQRYKVALPLGSSGHPGNFRFTSGLWLEGGERVVGAAFNTGELRSGKITLLVIC
jgi:hypothetical protein